jgi:HPt (histidine-containing phosphotransfer) domain-containing protein
MDPAVLLDMGEKLRSTEIANRFARDYAAMWDLRRKRLAAALDRRDYPAAIDAVISLKVSSAMVGGVRLAQLAEQLEQAIRQGDLDAGLALMGKITHYGHKTVNELRLR